MNIQFRHRCLSMMLVLVMLFTMSPVSVIAEEELDHSHDEAVTVLEVADLSVSASASISARMQTVFVFPVSMRTNPPFSWPMLRNSSPSCAMNSRMRRVVSTSQLLTSG